MDRKYFLSCLEFTNKKLENVEINRAYNSIGSNVFFKFGRQVEELLPNGKKTLTNEWTIWIGNASWRITKYGKYIVGSHDNREIICKILEGFLGKCFLSIDVISQYLDVEFSFEDGYKIITFFNWSVEDQWFLFLPDNRDVVIDCSTKESIDSLRMISGRKRFNYFRKKLHVLLSDIKVDEIIYRENNFSGIVFSENYCVELGGATWRLEKENKYCFGGLDYYFISRDGNEEKYKSELSELIEKKIKSVRVDSLLMDMRIEFEGGYVLEVFTNCKTDPWKITRSGKTLLSANV